MASVQKKGAGWRVRWREGGRDAPMKVSPLYDTKAKAVEAAERIEAELAAAKTLHRGDLLDLRTILVRWRQDRIAAGNDERWTTQSAAYCGRMAEAHNWKTVQDITPEAVSRWRAGGGRSRSGGEMRAVLRWAAEVLGQPVDPRTLIRLRPPKAKRSVLADLLTDEQVVQWQAQADAMGGSAGALVHCLSTYGWRPITAARLRAGHVDLAAGAIRLRVKASSGQDEIAHPLAPATVARLRPLVEGKQASAPVFRWGDGGGFSETDGIPTWFRRHFRHGVYDLKRFAISRMLSRGLPPQTVAMFTGHRTLSQVLLYARTNEQTARAALAVLV